VVNRTCGCNDRRMGKIERGLNAFWGSREEIVGRMFRCVKSERVWAGLSAFENADAALGRRGRRSRSCTRLGGTLGITATKTLRRGGLSTRDAARS
jgi:hypothetical protein